MQNNNDLIGIIITVLLGFTGKDMAHTFGPLVAVFLAASGGAAYYIGKRGNMTAWKALKIYVLAVSIALVLTLPLAELLQLWLKSIELPKSIVVPIAFIITAFPNHIRDGLMKLKAKLWKP